MLSLVVAFPLKKKKSERKRQEGELSAHEGAHMQRRLDDPLPPPLSYLTATMAPVSPISMLPPSLRLMVILGEWAVSSLVKRMGHLFIDDYTAPPPSLLPASNSPSEEVFSVLHHYGFEDGASQ